jgi:hypothetical protein
MSDFFTLILFLGVPLGSFYFAMKLKLRMENNTLKIAPADLLEFLPDRKDIHKIKFSYQKTGWSSGRLIVKNVENEIIGEIIFRRQTYTNPQPYLISDIIFSNQSYQVRTKTGLMGATNSELFRKDNSGHYTKIGSHSFSGISMSKGNYFYDNRNYSVSTSVSQLFNSCNHFEIYENNTVIGWMYRDKRVICSYMQEDVEALHIFIIERESKWLLF